MESANKPSTTVRIERDAIATLRVSVLRKYGTVRDHLTDELSKAAEDRAAMLDRTIEQKALDK